ncbi:MAG: ATP-binding protein [Nanoarchaeota archaeon]
MPQFRTKARAVDLLGKGQIADLPTAISELWKNGYDAYGDNLEAHLYFEEYKNVQEPFFVLSDDGIGMSEEDILNKWIVIGTDSKTDEKPEKKGPDTLNKEPRTKTGEKGIGRLSVAYLGPQMLMLTKKYSEDSIQALYFDWRILDNYNLFLEDIVIPLKKLTSEDGFQSTFLNLRKDFNENLSDSSQWKGYEKLKETVYNDNKDISLPNFFYDEVLKDFESGEKGHGTKFIIFKPDEQLLSLKYYDNPEPEDQETIRFIMSGLSGLSNVFSNKESKFDTSFWIYKSQTPINIISQRNFFTPEDFNICDHSIVAEIDEEGSFDTTLRIYDQKGLKHLFRPNRPKGKTPYGPFYLKLGYIQQKSESIMTNAEWNRLEKIRENYGGLYIYRDGFRVLPYGRKDADFLEFEERRSRGAGYYFFSYRRMFGYIEISRNANKQLKDKAGREGLISNKASREFKEDLKAFFIDLARKYFGTNAKEEYKNEQKKEIKEEKIEKEREKEERKTFNKIIKNYPQELDLIQSKLNSLVNELNRKLNQSSILYEEIEELMNEIETYKIRANNLAPPKPKRFKPTDNQREKLYSYEKKYQTFKQEVAEQAEKVVQNAQQKLKDKELLKEFDNRLDQYQEHIEEIIRDYEERLNKGIDNLKLEFTEEKNNQIKELERHGDNIYPKSLEKQEIQNKIESLKVFYYSLYENITEKLLPIVEHVERLTLNIDEDQLVGYYKNKYQEIKEKWQDTQELAQLGIAVEIIDHQFNALYSELANIITSFKNLIKENEKAQNNYNLLVSTFEHLENNYKFLTPLYRTTGRIRKDISGKELRKYVEGFFEKVLIDKNIKLTSSEAFEKASFFTYESILKPVFINVVNNSVYWLKSSNERKIHFDYEDGKMLLMNSGEKIDDVYIDEDIFKLFFSRKPRGRGIGLYLAKNTLNSVGFDITATNDPKYNKLDGACFIIKKLHNN